MVEREQMFRVAAGAYDRFVGRYSTELAERVCDAARVAPPMRALDVGCGPGALTAALAARLGPESLAAVDPSEPFVEACRDRVPGADVRLAAAEDLPFPAGSFDAVLSQLVLNFVSDAGAALAQMRRVARRGAVIVATVWDYGGGMTMLRGFWDAVADVCGTDARDEAVVMRYCTEATLGGLWRDSGLGEVDVHALTTSARYDDFEDLWSPFTAGVGPAGAFTVGLDEDVRERVRTAYHHRLGAPDGPFTLTARAWCAVGRN